MKKYLVGLTFVLCTTPLSAQTTQDSIPINTTDSISAYTSDSIIRKRPKAFGRRFDKFSSSKFCQITSMGVPLLVGGLIAKGEDTHFRNLRNDYLPKFSHDADDYLQFVPAAVLLGMRAWGIEGRSSWGRMIVSDVFSAILMATTVNTLKRSTRVMRPDGSSRSSFPSGHTATAFMTATMLTKEYGHRSPFIGIGAYTAATATGLMRMANNKHWLSDVLTGAGIGILSTEMGYFLADVIFKEHGLNKFETDEKFDRLARPSFVSLYFGMNIPLSGYDFDENHQFRTSSGSSVGVEGAYFINPYLGFGGRVSVSNTSIIVNNDEAEENRFDAATFMGGAYLSYPLSTRWQVGTKLLVGSVYYPQLSLTDLSIPSHSGFCLGSGVSLSFRGKSHYGTRFFLDYNLLPSHSQHSHEWMNTLTLGSSFMITF